MRVIEKESGFCEIYDAPESVTKYLSMSVTPIMRYYKEEPTPHWCVYKDHVLYAVQLGYTTLGHVDYSGVSNQLQMQIAQEKQNWTVRDTKKLKQEKTLNKVEAYATLFLTPGAPDFIIEAVWKAIALKHHPDKGGDEEQFKIYNEAHKRIKRK